MALTVKFELNDEDLEHFRVLMRGACEAAESKCVEDIVSAASGLLTQVRGSNAPAFVLQRLDTLETLISMITDDEWRLPDEERVRVINAVAYFCEPEGLIPDHVPGLGFLDDAMMIELVGHELKHEIEAYEDFCSFRVGEAQRRLERGASSDRVTREDWLSAKRAELQSRMRSKAGGLRNLFSLFTSS